MEHGGVIEAAINGVRSGTLVDFTKTYGSGASAIYSDPIDYVGSLTEDGFLVKGTWSLLEWDGSFEMRREAGSQELEGLWKDVSETISG